MLGVCYIISTTSPTLFVALGAIGGFDGGSGPLQQGLGQRPKETFFGPNIRLMNLPMVFAHGFGNYGFLPMVFCRSGQGNYDYALI